MFAPQSAPASGDVTGILVGRAVDWASGKPYADAIVVVRGIGGRRRYAVTNHSGSYLIRSLEPGTYTIVANHQLQLKTLDAWAQGICANAGCIGTASNKIPYSAIIGADRVTYADITLGIDVNSCGRCVAYQIKTFYPSAEWVDTFDANAQQETFSSDVDQLDQLCATWYKNGIVDGLTVDGSDTWALVSCAGTYGGGQFVATKSKSLWTKKFGAGGVFAANELVQFGVPSSVATYLMDTVDLLPIATPQPTPTPNPAPSP